MSSPLSRVLTRRAALFRELADLDLELARVLEAPREGVDAVLSLEGGGRLPG